MELLLGLWQVVVLACVPPGSCRVYVVDNITRADCYETLITFEVKPRKLFVSHSNHCPRLLSYLMHITYCTFSGIPIIAGVS